MGIAYVPFEEFNQKKEDQIEVIMKTIEIKELTVAYDEEAVLENINLEIERVRFYSFSWTERSREINSYKNNFKFFKTYNGGNKNNGKSYKKRRKKKQPMYHREEVLIGIFRQLFLMWLKWGVMESRILEESTN